MIAATTPVDDLDAMLGGATATVLAGGHTHIQLVRRYADAHLINTGSVGLPGVNAGSRATAMCAGRSTPSSAWTRGVSLSNCTARRSMSRQCARAVVAGMPHAAWWSSRWEHA